MRGGVGDRVGSEVGGGAGADAGALEGDGKLGVAGDDADPEKRQVCDMSRSGKKRSVIDVVGVRPDESSSL